MIDTLLIGVAGFALANLKTSKPASELIGTAMMGACATQLVSMLWKGRDA